MSSAFNLLTAGGARFDKSRFKADIELFSSKSNKGKGKARADPSLPSSLNIFSDAQPHHAGTSSSNNATRNSEDDEDMEEPIAAPPKQKITISGPEPLPSSLSASLESLTTHPSSPLPLTAASPLISALRGARIQSLWGVQTAVGGALLADKDVICVAPTGSGKTLAYVLPTLVRLVDPSRNLRGASNGTTGKKGGAEKEEGKGIRAVIVVPTHDLAIQIHEVCRAVMVGRSWRCLVLSKATQKAVCESSPGVKYKRGANDEGEQEMEESDESDEEEDEAHGTLGLDVLIATPERLHHLLEKELLSLSETRHLVLDESDRLLSPDFLPQVKPIVAACTHPKVQKCLLSATMPPMAEKLARTWMRDGGVRIVVGVKDSAVTTVSQSLLYTATEQGKLLALRNLIAEGNLPYPSLVFVQSIERAEELHKMLALEGLRVGLVHGGRSKAARDEAVTKFREGEVWVLVVTEVLARGMDFRGVKVVINYDFPQTLQSYIHRIGRTGRAGRPGKSITFVNTEDSPYLRTIARVLEKSGCEVPAYMLDLPKVSKDVKKRLAKAPVKRSRVGGGGRDVAKEDARKRREMVKASRRRKRAPPHEGAENADAGSE